MSWSLPYPTHVVLCSKSMVEPWRAGGWSQSNCLDPLWLSVLGKSYSRLPRQRRGTFRKAAYPRKREEGSIKETGLLEPLPPLPPITGGFWQKLGFWEVC